MKISEIIYEGISDIVYHFTSLVNGYKILSEDRFILSSVTGHDIEQEVNISQKYYFMSTTRSLTGNFHLGHSEGVIFTLNGKKLSDNYSGGPRRYFFNKDKTRNSVSDEFEDRVFSNKPYIENASSYIKESHVLYQKNNKHSIRYAKKILLFSKQRGIEFYLYDNPRHFGKKRKALQEVPREFNKRSTKVTRIPDTPYFYENSISYFKPWLELYYKNNKKDLSKDARNVLFAFVKWPREGIVELKNLMSNYRKTNNKYLQKIIDIMRKEKITTLEEFIELLNNKWK